MSAAPLRVSADAVPSAIAGRPEAGRAVWSWRDRAAKAAEADRLRRRRMRRSAVVAVVVPSLVAWGTGHLVVLAVGAAFALASGWLGTKAPPSARDRAERVVHRFGEGVGAVVGFLVLAPVFYLVVTPLGLARRAMGTDALRRRRDPSRASYWEPRTRTPSPRRPF